MDSSFLLKGLEKVRQPTHHHRRKTFPCRQTKRTPRPFLKEQGKQKLQRQEAGAAIIKVERIAIRVVVEAESLLAFPSFRQLPPYLRSEPPVEALKPPLPSTQHHSGVSKSCHGHLHFKERKRDRTSTKELPRLILPSEERGQVR